VVCRLSEFDGKLGTATDGAIVFGTMKSDGLVACGAKFGEINAKPIGHTFPLDRR